MLRVRTYYVSKNINILPRIGSKEARAFGIHCDWQDTMNYEFNLLNHVGVVAKIVCAAAAAAETAAHEGGDNTPSGPTGRGVKTDSATRSV